MNPVRDARIKKTMRFYEDRSGFLSDIHHDISRLEKEAAKRGMHPAVRLNGTSDLKWESISPVMFTLHPDVSFYDYTKSPHRMRKFLRGEFPANYFLTLSRSETNHRVAMNILRAGG